MTEMSLFHNIIIMFFFESNGFAGLKRFNPLPLVGRSLGDRCQTSPEWGGYAGAQQLQGKILKRLGLE